MRLTVDLLHRAEQRTNCLGERELVLNGYGIPAIENMAAIISSSSSSSTTITSNGSRSSGEEFDTLNICNNLLIRLDNFSRWYRLSNLIASNNRIESMDGNNVMKNIPNLISLTLSYNNISSLSMIHTIGQSCQLLQFLDLTGNSVTRRPHYRLYTIYNIPTLRCLDYVKVKREERIRATKFVKSTTGAALASDVQQQLQSTSTTTVKTFTPGESMDGTTVVTLFLAEEKEAIRNLLANAGSIQEVEAIESAVQKGILPDQLLSLRQQQQQQQQQPPPSPQKRTNSESNNGDDNNNHDMTEPAQKRFKETSTF